MSIIYSNGVFPTFYKKWDSRKLNKITDFR